MLDNKSNGNTNGVIQAQRSSCDRCRSQKLKCSVQGGPGTGTGMGIGIGMAMGMGMGTDGTERPRCERCIRANVPCVFSRRNQSRRQATSRRKSSVKESTTGTPEAIIAPIPVPTTTPTTAAAAAAAAVAPSQPALDSDSLVMHFGSLDGGTESLTSLPTDQSWPKLRMMDSFDHLDDPMFEQSGMSVDFAGPESYYAGELAPVLSNGPMAVHVLDNESQDLASAAAAATTKQLSVLHPDDRSRAQDGLLASLIVDILQELTALQDSRWASNDCQQSLDEYPVGAILDLAQRFGQASHAVLQTHSCVTYHGDNPGLKTPAVPPLVVAGGMLLLKLIHLVLNHFQRYLRSSSPALTRPGAGSFFGSGSSISSGSSGSVGSNSLPSEECSPDSDRRGLRLNELQESVPGLGKIHKAVCLLQGEFNRGVRHLLVATDGPCSLSQEVASCAGGLQDACGALDKQLHSVGDLLRDRMGL